MCGKILCVLMLIFSLGCEKKGQTEGPQRKKILCTIAQIGHLVSAIGGEGIEVQVLIRGELDPHSYELVKGDDEKIAGADLLFYNGLGLEHGASLSSMIRSHPNGCAVGEEIARLSPEKILWVGQVKDPHVWMDVSLWAQAVDPILQRIIALDPEGASDYSMRAEELKKALAHLDEQVGQTLHAIPKDQRFLVTSHDAFQYFARRYLSEPQESDWGKRFKAPEGLAPDGQLNPLDLQKMIEHLARHDIHVLFPESNVSRGSIHKLVDVGKKMGLDVRISSEVLYGDALKGSYTEAMLHNADAIAHALMENKQ